MTTAQDALRDPGRAQTRWQGTTGAPEIRAGQCWYHAACEIIAELGTGGRDRSLTLTSPAGRMDIERRERGTLSATRTNTKGTMTVREKHPGAPNDATDWLGHTLGKWDRAAADGRNEPQSREPVNQKPNEAATATTEPEMVRYTLDENPYGPGHALVHGAILAELLNQLQHGGAERAAIEVRDRDNADDVLGAVELSQVRDGGCHLTRTGIFAPPGDDCQREVETENVRTGDELVTYLNRVIVDSELTAEPPTAEPAPAGTEHAAGGETELDPVAP